LPAGGCLLTGTVASRSFQPVVIFGACGGLGRSARQGSSVEKAKPGLLQQPIAKASGQEDGRSAARRRDRRPLWPRPCPNRSGPAGEV